MARRRTRDVFFPVNFLVVTERWRPPPGPNSLVSSQKISSRTRLSQTDPTPGAGDRVLGSPSVDEGRTRGVPDGSSSGDGVIEEVQKRVEGR